MSFKVYLNKKEIASLDTYDAMNIWVDRYKSTLPLPWVITSSHLLQRTDIKMGEVR